MSCVLEWFPTEKGILIGDTHEKYFLKDMGFQSKGVSNIGFIVIITTILLWCVHTFMLEFSTNYETNLKMDLIRQFNK